MQLSNGIFGVSVAAISLSSGLEGLTHFVRFLGGQQVAAAPSPVLTVLGASAVLVLGAWLCVALLRHRGARLSLILAWSCAALLLAVLFHLNHAAYAAPCRGQAAVQAPLNRRCTELQQRGRL
jgi:glycerol-3-phosphate acyltransferase PlsY